MSGGFGGKFDSGDYHACLDRAVAGVGYDAVRAEQAARRATGDHHLVGVGVAMWIDCTPMNRPGEWASVEVVVKGDGVRLVVRGGANDQGKAHATTWGLLLQERLHLPVHAVDLRHGDTRHVPTGEGTGSARSLMLAGGAVAAAGDRIVELARDAAADLLEAAPVDVVLTADGRFSVRGSPAVSRWWAEVASSAHLVAAVDYEHPGPTFPAGCHAAVVEVDRETGATTLLVSPVNALGAKGIGQSGAIGSTAAVQNAVVDAVSHLGVRHIDRPLTPERVWRVLQHAMMG